MNTGLISTRYATALLDYAIERGEQDKVYEAVKMLSQMFWEVPRFGEALHNPILSPAEKKKLILTASGGEVSEAWDRFIDLLLENNRIEKLHYIALRFQDLYRDKNHILSATLTTAVDTDKSVYERLKSIIAKQTGGTVEMTQAVDPSIVGGFILQIGDNRWDASVASQLRRIKNELKEINN
ncbi:MAG TPA: ATP synthase F1 subunit delta [Porphyromonadaceae bacterium]|jgi:F-type H+-transporting ATPase subunit delta|uniref:F0F1 ATP synthase subunit delta n=1 Tax=Limibacterium fermenti TaxID=3229863 RepID=UPI000E8EB648|nr:ATP synthase F1 subunit delta [Porphyromonadaceae bacterium]HBL33554.1 ATP synthase F1 subunit delta [Porphyromonadaceae bacterium]HBX45699.1 ATP synthase F1 subunit delta [Porphyromonadaceae bacterium]HCM19297.1 ATP synthase F1 subunit delta [Porphyromonadaceae bacterium]